MADKQSLNATFFAFRKRERGGVLTMATITYFAVALTMSGLFAYLNWQAVVDYMRWYGELITSVGAGAGKMDPTDPSAFAAIMPPASVVAAGPSYLLLFLASVILLAAWEAACLRWMIHGEVKGLFGLSLGADTWRVFLGYWIWLVLFFVAYFAFLIVALGAGIGVGVAAQGNPDAILPGVLIVCVIVLVALAACIYCAVRLAPAAATSVARRRFAFFDAWKVSRGRFWGLFGAFLLLSLMYYVLCAVFGAIFVVAVVGATHLTPAGETQSLEQVVQAFASPPLIALCVGLSAVFSIGAFVLYVAVFGVNARAAALALEEGKIAAEG